MKDRSLDDFRASDTAEANDDAEDEGAEGTETGTAGGADATEATASDEAAAVDSERGSAALATARWDPEGGTCPACGETVERRWRADEASAEFVCADCKEW